MTSIILEKIPKEDIQLMTQAGFVAISHGWYVKAGVIFSGLRALRPKSEVPSIGFAMNFIAQNKPQEALDLLQKEEHFFVQNASSYHLILKAIIFRLMNRFQDAWRELSMPDVAWGDYASLAQALIDDIKTKV